MLHTAGQASLGELREEARRTKAAADADPDATYRRLHAARSARAYTDGEGAWHLHVRTTPDAGAEIGTVLDALTDDIFKVAYRDGRREARDAYAADALRELARRAREAKPVPSASGPGAPSVTSCSSAPTSTPWCEGAFVEMRSARSMASGRFPSLTCATCSATPSSN